MGEGLFHAFGGEDSEIHDWDEWQQRIIMSLFVTLTTGQVLTCMGFTGQESMGETWAMLKAIGKASFPWGNNNKII